MGELSTSADLKPARNAFQKLGDFFLGKAEPDPLYGPRSVVCTPDGLRVWIADPGGRCLHLFDLDRRIYRKVTTAAQSPLLSPVGVCLGPANSIFLLDAEQATVFRLSADRGQALGAFPLPEEVGRAVGLAYAPQWAELAIVDVVSHNVKILDTDGNLRAILGQRGSAPGTFNYPTAVAAGRDAWWTADTGNNRIQALGRTGEPMTRFGRAGDAPGDLAMPKGIAFDSEEHVYVVDGRFENVQVFDAEGTLLLVFGEEGAGAGEFWLPSGAFIDAQDRIWICDTYNSRVQVFQYLAPTAALGTIHRENAP